MNTYIVYEIQLKPKKGKLPDVCYQYISNESLINWDWRLTRDRKNAYIFDEDELVQAKFIADCWKMKVEQLK